MSSAPLLARRAITSSRIIKTAKPPQCRPSTRDAPGSDRSVTRNAYAAASPLFAVFLLGEASNISSADQNLPIRPLPGSVPPQSMEYLFVGPPE
ncbi:hypothetical protein EXIGLDRAFT_764737 [Exidia glandulosa HHB12029]|uniref:Uncharacterized protein n=1 Tax=Exidia glandulosa HHB12029 TaxID=1314781 RepID=A0A165KZV3_EXIGL|nr:hypothetical protein EXIGLDRAFT_764737 [Exidia glandulosa HHB12029]